PGCAVPVFPSRYSGAVCGPRPEKARIGHTRYAHIPGRMVSLAPVARRLLRFGTAGNPGECRAGPGRGRIAVGCRAGPSDQYPQGDARGALADCYLFPGDVPRGVWLIG